MGADVTMANDFIEVRGTGTLNGVDLDMSQISDTAQTVAAIAPFADGPTRITGIGFIRKKETDRVAAVVNELQRMGIDAVEEADGFLINPGTPQPATIETYTITAMAMSFAITGLMTPGITIADPACLRCGSCSAAPTKQEPLRQAIDDESWPPRYPYAGRVTERLTSFRGLYRRPPGIRAVRWRQEVVASGVRRGHHLHSTHLEPVLSSRSARARREPQGRWSADPGASASIQSRFVVSCWRVKSAVSGAGQTHDV
ncbi:3-phosphoshikimate 1-carboxyvinyltransferase [Nymphon striatum]|nr:3-phosphoshikimate 1-carboxyvinyltransferase [Nymphon striatum]